MKRILKIAAMFMSVVCFSMTVAAAVAIEPFATNGHTLNLGFSGTNAICELTINGAAGTTRIDNVSIALRDNLGNVVGEWRNLSANGSTFRWSGTASPVVAGRTYTLAFKATVHRNGVASVVTGQIVRTR